MYNLIPKNFLYAMMHLWKERQWTLAIYKGPTRILKTQSCKEGGKKIKR